jgi:hypothetical protein
MSTSLHTPPTMPLAQPRAFRELLPNGNLRVNYHLGQLRALYSRSRFIGVIAGTQSGKTSFGGHWLLREIGLRGAGDYMVVTPTFKLLELKALKEFRIIFEQLYNLGTYTTSPVRRFVFSHFGMEYIHGVGNFDPRNPTTVYFGYADDPDSLESATIKGAWLDECGQKRFRLGSFEALMRRGAINQARMLLTTTPYDLGWLYTEVYQKYKAEVAAGKTQSHERTYDIVNFPSVANPAFPHAEDAHARATLPFWKYQLFYRGKFVKPAGLIYDLYDDRLVPLGKVFPNEPVPRHFVKTLALDFGAPNFAGVFIATNPLTWEHYVIDEYHPQETRIASEHVRHLTSDGTRRFEHVVGGSPSETQWREELRAAGLDIERNEVKLVEVGIDRVYGALKESRLWIYERCKRVRDEFSSYSRELDDRGEATLKIDNKSAYHFLDAVRYGVGKLESRNREWTQDDMTALDPDSNLEPVEDGGDEFSPDASDESEALDNRRRLRQNRPRRRN